MSTLVYLDSWMVIVAKEAGEAVQTKDNAQKSLVQHWREVLGDSRLQPAHRIDQPVSGLVVLSRTTEAFRSLQSAFMDKHVQRYYLAVVDTPPEPAEGVLEDLLEQRGTRTMVVPEGSENGKHARLRYQTVGSTRHHTIVLVTLETGRHHQIRVQLASRGWHVVGDARYGARRSMRDRSIALHGWYLSLPHPGLSLPPVSLTASLPDTPLWRGVGESLTLPSAATVSPAR